MTAADLHTALNGAKYGVAGFDAIKYLFHDGTLTITGDTLPTKVHYEVYKENDMFFLRTTPNLYTEDLRIFFDANPNSRLSLVGKADGRDFVTLKRETF